MVNKIKFNELETSENNGFIVLESERALVSDFINWCYGDRTGKIVAFQKDYGQEFTQEGYAYIRFNETAYEFDSALHANLFNAIGTNILPAMDGAYLKHSVNDLEVEESKLRLHFEVLNKKIKHNRAEYEERLANKDGFSGNAGITDTGTVVTHRKVFNQPFDFTDIVRNSNGSASTINNNPGDAGRIVVSFTTEGEGNINKFKESRVVFYILEKI